MPKIAEMEKICLKKKKEKKKVLIPWLVSVLGLAIADVLSCSRVMIIMIASYARYIRILLG